MYASDLTNAQWQDVKNILNEKERKRKHDLREIWNALFYVVKTGCQWRMLPTHYPKWQLVYYYYTKWANNEVYDLILAKLRGMARKKRNQTEEPSVGIVDSQTVRSCNNRSLQSVDGNKKVKGIKRHAVVDKNGWLMAIMVGAAHVHDCKAAEWLFRVLKELVAGITLLIADGGYRGELIEKVKNLFGYLLKIILRNEQADKKQFTPLPMRWVIERTFSWFDNDRRLCRNYELLYETSENMVKLATIKLLLKKI